MNNRDLYRVITRASRARGGCSAREAARALGIDTDVFLNCQFIRQRRRRRSLYRLLLTLAITGILAGALGLLNTYTVQGGALMGKDDDIIRIALELKQEDDHNQIEKAVLAEEGINADYLKQATQIYNQRLRSRRKLMRGALTGVLIVLLLGGAALLQRLTREEKPAVYEYGVSLDKQTYTPAAASVSLPNNETFYFHAALEHLPPDILITAECHLKTATGTTLFTSVTALKTTSRAVHRLTCAFSGHQVNAGSWFMELDLKQQETGEDTNRMPFQTFGRFPVLVMKGGG